MESIRVSQVIVNGRYGISRGYGRPVLLSPGVNDILPGWTWLDRDHPENDFRFQMELGAVRVSGSLADGRSRAIRDLMGV